VYRHAKLLPKRDMPAIPFATTQHFASGRRPHLEGRVFFGH